MCERPRCFDRGMVLLGLAVVGLVGIEAADRAARDEPATAPAGSSAPATAAAPRLAGTQEARAPETVWMEHQCEEGDAAECTKLGLRYQYGNGVPEDLARAAELFGSACELGEGRGCSVLGILHQEGRIPGHGADCARGSALAHRGCELGDGLGCTVLGNLAKAGRCSTKNDEMALKFYSLGCEMGEPSGCEALALLREPAGGVAMECGR